MVDQLVSPAWTLLTAVVTLLFAEFLWLRKPAAAPSNEGSIASELLKLGIEISQSTAAKHMLRRPHSPSPTSRSFLRNHALGIAAIDTFLVPSATFQLLFVMLILPHDRRKIVRFDLTEHPTASWLSRQVIEAFPWDTAPRFRLRDRDSSHGPAFNRRVEAIGITEVITAARSPWQNPFLERVIGSIRRECWDRLIVFNERHLRRLLSSYAD